MNTAQILLVSLGMALVTLLTRGAFLLSQRELPMPDWLKEGLRYAPLAAMVAVVAPELLMSQGQLIASWKDARIYGALAGTAWFFWRRSMLGTIVAGTTVLLLCRLGLGW